MDQCQKVLIKPAQKLSHEPCPNPWTTIPDCSVAVQTPGNPTENQQPKAAKTELGKENVVVGDDALGN